MRKAIIQKSCIITLSIYLYIYMHILVVGAKKVRSKFQGKTSECASHTFSRASWSPIQENPEAKLKKMEKISDKVNR